MHLFDGRINKETYIAGHFLLYAFGGIGVLLFIVVPYPFAWVIIIAFLYLIILFYISLVIRRCHDAGLDGSDFMWWWYYPTQETPNQWGEPSKPGVDFEALFGFNSNRL
jgi:uncharacterized membrane protein YhaH (DUF805 family)